MLFKGRKNLVWLLAFCFLLSQIITSPIFAQSSGTDRISGADRYKTAVAVSQKGWKTSDYAVLARGDNFADALCAGPLAQKYGGPILLTQPNQLNSDTLKELQRLGVKHLFITGGVGAVSQSVENSLKANGIDTIERIFGNDRYKTSVKIAEKIGNSSKVVLATGSDFPDALSISGIAAKLEMPILLTDKNSLPTTVGDYLRANTVAQTYVVGGTGVISSEVASSVPNPSRLAGNDRYETNKVIMQNFTSELNFENIYVAVGTQFADALTGAVLAAKSSSPLVLTGKTLPAGTADYIQTKLKLSTKVKGLGGKLAVPSSILQGLVASKEQISVEEKYSTAGTYGPETGTKTIQGSVIISAADVTLQNTIIEGDLLLGSSIGDGNVELRDVTVQGKTIVNGGGPNSIIMYNFNGQTVVVDVPDGANVRLVAQGSTSVSNVSMEGNGTLDQSDVTGSGFVTVEIPAGAQVVLSGDFNEVNVEAAGANINVTSGNITTVNISETASGAGVNLGSGSSVGTLNANAQSNITGQGQITTANVNASGVSIVQTPTTTTVASGLTANVGGQQQSGTTTQPPAGGGGGGSSTVSVSAITVTGNDHATTITTNSGTLQMSAAVTPTNASNKNVTWSVLTSQDGGDETGYATISSSGLLSAVANGTVTVKATSVSTGSVYGTLEITISGQVLDLQPQVTISEGSAVFQYEFVDRSLEVNYGLAIDLYGLNLDTSTVELIQGTVADQTQQTEPIQLSSLNISSPGGIVAYNTLAEAGAAFGEDFSTWGAAPDIVLLNLAGTIDDTPWTQTDVEITLTESDKASFMSIAPEISLYGSGTEVDPWKISKIEDLASIGKDHSGASATWEFDDYYILMNNLDFNEDASYSNAAATVTDWNGDGESTDSIKTQFTTGVGWLPIEGERFEEGEEGSESIIVPFSGNFNGNNKTISNLYINRTDEDKQSFFASTHGAIIQRLGLVNVDISASGSTGALVGEATNSTITDCYVTGRVAGDSMYLGGLIGWLGGESGGSSSLSNSYSKANVSGTGDWADYVGGLAGGVMQSSTVSGCYTSGRVSSINGDGVGGLVGDVGQTITITNSYSLGDVTGNNNVGGLVGSASEMVSIADCYAIGGVSGAEVVGGLVGLSNSEFMDGLSLFNSIAFNYSVSGTSDVHRVLGLANDTVFGDTSLGSNYANASMDVNRDTTTGNTNDENGADINNMTNTAASPIQHWDLTEENSNGDICWKVLDETERPVLFVYRNETYEQIGDDDGYFPV